MTVKQESGDKHGDKIRCDACPVMCYIAEGRAGACDRYANEDGELIRIDPLTVIEGANEVVPFLGDGWDGEIVRKPDTYLTAIGAGTTYPDYKPAPFIVSQQVAGSDMVTVVTEGIFSYCGVKVKIDTDRHIGPEQAVRASGRRTHRPCHHRRIRQPDALPGRRASPDRWRQRRRAA